MSDLEKSSDRSGEIEVTDHRLAALLEWVSNPATLAEEIAWSAQEFQGIRDWLKAHKAAASLRQKAVRTELIALRRVALAGLAHKLTGGNHMKPTATWLAELTDEGFATLLAEVTGEQTPIALWRTSKREGDGLRMWFEREEILGGRPMYAGKQSYRGVSDAARRLLDDIQIEGTSFTVQEAADRLATALEEDGIQVHQALRGTPLTQLVRNAIHRAADGYELLVDREGRTARVPAFVTYEDNEGITRVPFHSASLEQFQAFVELHEEKAAALTRRAEEYRTLLAALELVHQDASTNCVRTLNETRRRRNLKAQAAELLNQGDAA